MKLMTGVLIWAAGAVVCSLPARRTSSVAAQQPMSQGARTPVVVELFTSEGCSSCPPADQLLLKLQEEQPIGNAEVIALEEHVDYWDKLGWVDPFSSAWATARQFSYAGALGNGNSYTPQMVVDGQTEFVGSREGQARGVIGSAAGKKKVEVNVTLGERAGNDAQSVRIAVGALHNSASAASPEIWMAITETGLHSNVKSGENSGEDLHHAAVVRKLVKIGDAQGAGDESFSGQERIQLDGRWKRENVRVVVFVQEKHSKKILGASSARLPV
jgi:hypothetical protein